MDDFGVCLDERLDSSDQSKGMNALSQGSAGGAPAVELLSAIWDCVEECGLGGWILQTAAGTDPNLLERLRPSFELTRKKWVAPLTKGGLTELQATLVYRAASAITSERRSSRLAETVLTASRAGGP